MAHHYHSRYHFSYAVSAKHHFFTSIGLIAFLLILVLFVLHWAVPVRLVDLQKLSFIDIVVASLATLYRLTIAYLLALVVAVPLAIFTTAHPKIEKILLPVFDILQSVPAFAFFPIIVLVFIKLSLFDFAAIFFLFMVMLWNLVFSMIGGLKAIPAEIHATAQVFGAKGFKALRLVTLPAIFPYIVTGSLLAWGSSWTIIIVAEVLHNYIPGSSPSQDLFGLGSLLVDAAYQNNNLQFLAALVAMILVISVMNFFIWQKLLRLAERFKFD